MKNKYKRIEEFSDGEIKKALDNVQKDYYYPNYHIAPQSGLLNDPNGLLFKDGVYYIHYQVHPVDPIHGLKYWELVTTKDFLDYEFHGLSNKPELVSESHGVFSGSAFIENNIIKILYTGNHRDEKSVRHQTQILGQLDNNLQVVNKKNIIEHDFKLFDEHIRDPKLIEINNKKYIYFGAKNNKSKQGVITFYDYQSKAHAFDLKLNVKNFGYMWECPNIEKINDKYLIIFCPQGAQNNKDISFSNSNSVVYCFADNIDTKTGKLINQSKILLMDYGTDYYAPQIFEVGNKMVAYAWLGTLEVVYPSDQNNWQGMLTIPREISIENDYILQKPYQDFTQNVLCQKQIKKTNKTSIKRSQVIKFELEGNVNIKIGNKNYYLAIEFLNDRIIVDRSFCEEKIKTAFGNQRECKRIENKQIVEIWIDNSAVEIFVNNYKSTFSMRFFIKDFDTFSSSADLELIIFDVKESKYNNKYN